jgi:hypothetical protein
MIPDLCIFPVAFQDEDVSPLGNVFLRNDQAELRI